MPIFRKLFYALILVLTLLVGATAALVFISAYGGHEFKWKEVAILFVILMAFSYFVFVKGLTLPFPMWPAAWS